MFVQQFICIISFMNKLFISLRLDQNIRNIIIYYVNSKTYKTWKCKFEMKSEIITNTLITIFCVIYNQQTTERFFCFDNIFFKNTS